MLTRIELFMLQRFLHISCLRNVIANGPAHFLEGELAGRDVQITKLARLGVNLCTYPTQKVLDIGPKWDDAGAFDRGSS